MRRPIKWIETDEDGVRAEVRVTISGTTVRWQRKRRDQDEWHYDFEPNDAQWAELEDVCNRRQERGRGIGEAAVRAIERALARRDKR
jgi:hypothetical protein